MKKPKRPTDREIVKAVQVLTDYGHYFRVVHGPRIAKRIIEIREGMTPSGKVDRE